MVIIHRFRRDIGSGLRAPIFCFICALLGLLAVPPAQAQNQGQQRPAPSAVPIPDPLELNKLVWSTMAAVHHANLAGNYSVLRDLSATGFQVQNDSAALAQTFASLRQSGIDLSNALLLAPTFSVPPKMVAANVMQLRGYFGLRPTAIAFDLVYEWSAGRWRLFGISIAPANLAQIQPGGAPVAPPPVPNAPPKKGKKI